MEYQDRVIEVAMEEKRKCNEYYDEFIAKVREHAIDPNNFISMSEFENLRKICELSMHKSLTSLSSEILSNIDIKELSDSKKASSSRPE